jgi:isopentenyl phosphate kinase
MSLVFLKLGGSLITDKNKTDSPNLHKIEEIAVEIASALRDVPELQLVLGHGSGSFGHHAAREFNTRAGVSSPKEWMGFAHVWDRAHALNTIIEQALVKASIPALTFSPSSCIITRNHAVQSWNTTPLQMALKNHLVPLIHGDVVFDEQLGGTILSTEELFIALSKHLVPDQILLAGIEPGVWQNYPEKDTIISKITPATFAVNKPGDMRSSSPDVTGGMGSKIASMLEIIKLHSKTRISIFSGLESGNIYSSLTENLLGTLIASE